MNSGVLSKSWTTQARFEHPVPENETDTWFDRIKMEVWISVVLVSEIEFQGLRFRGLDSRDWVPVIGFKRFRF